MSFDYPNSWTVNRRSRVARILFSIAAVVCGLVGLGLVAGGTFAPPEMDRVRIGTTESYHINNFHLMYLAASVLLPAAAFFSWKASHRANLGFWRSTVRPAAMCGGAGLIGVGLSFSSFVAMGAMQGLGIIGATLGATALLFFWILRGPAFELNAGDAYWNRALALMFSAATLIAGIGSVKSFHGWSQDHYRFNRPGDAFAVEKVTRERWDPDLEDFRTEHRTYHLPRLQFNPQPIATALLALVAFGSLSEARYRGSLARRAGKSSFGKQF
jgi:hypothetical protein